MGLSGLRGYYAILDLKDAPIGDGATLMAHAEALLAAGPCVLQLRGKGLAAAVLRDVAARLLPACHAARVPFCVNDRVDVALAVGADAVHVGQDDLPLEAVLSLVRGAEGSGMSVGVSTHSLAQAKAAAEGGAAYIGFGPIFETRSKVNPDDVVGTELLAEVVSLVEVPVVAIGGITRANVDQVATAGAAAAALIGDIDGAVDRTAAGRSIVAAFTANPPPDSPRPRRKPRRVATLR